MCVRRFLSCLFILILIAVAGAFALYQWGDAVLVRVATPEGHYVEPPKGSGPDYRSEESWLARPGLPDNAAGWSPKGHVNTAIPTAATFYVHPTTYLERDRWNAPLDPAGEPSRRARIFVQTQGGLFQGLSEVWAPKYRQAAFGAFLLRSEDAAKALDLAYRDVRSAFDAFIASQPPERPILLAAHSQGSLHLVRLLADRRQALSGRLVAAYVVGWPVGTRSDLPATGLKPCDTPDAVSCVLSWQSFREPANTGLVVEAWAGAKGLAGVERSADEMLCTNPITGTRSGSAPPSANLGTLVPNGELTEAALEPGRVGAACSKGFLLIDGDIPDLGPFVLPGNNYHVYDYALFWGSVRADAERRVAAWAAR